MSERATLPFFAYFNNPHITISNASYAYSVIQYYVDTLLDRVFMVLLALVREG